VDGDFLLCSFIKNHNKRGASNDTCDASSNLNNSGGKESEFVGLVLETSMLSLSRPHTSTTLSITISN
jgi:hypothetical protein